MTLFEMVDEFIDKYEVDTDWNKLIVEENKELLKEAADVVYVMIGASATGQAMDGTLTAIVDVVDIFSQLFGEEVFFEAFNRVHESNMSKEGKNPATGKITKGPNYVAPDFDDLFSVIPESEAVLGYN